MIATRPALSETAALSARGPALGLLSVILRLLLLACAGLVMQVGWLVVWTLSYRLTHGNDYTYTLLV
ncbi:MAG TPA: hypothetical protein VGE94_19185, partial [Chloroflexota bacterium]